MHAIVSGRGGAEPQGAPQTKASTLNAPPPRISRAQSSRLVSLRYGVYIMHRTRNVSTQQADSRKELVPVEGKSTRAIRSLSDFFFIDLLECDDNCVSQPIVTAAFWD